MVAPTRQRWYKWFFSSLREFLIVILTFWYDIVIRELSKNCEMFCHSESLSQHMFRYRWLANGTLIGILVDYDCNDPRTMRNRIWVKRNGVFEESKVRKSRWNGRKPQARRDVVVDTWSDFRLPDAFAFPVDKPVFCIPDKSNYASYAFWNNGFHPVVYVTTGLWPSGSHTRIWPILGLCIMHGR